MTPQEAWKEVEEFYEGHTCCVMSDEAREAMGALLRRDWAVRVLDAWAYRPGFSGAWNNTRNEMVSRPDDEFMVELIEDGSDDDTNYHVANCPDAARLAAALAVFPTLPDAVRSELGECP